MTNGNGQQQGDTYIMANARRCTIFPQHLMVNQGRDERLFGDVFLCACGEQALGNTDESRAHIRCLPCARVDHDNHIEGIGCECDGHDTEATR